MTEILLQNIHHLATFDDERRQLQGVNLHVQDGKIAALSSTDLAPNVSDSCEIIDASRCLVIPGLINTHHHLFQTMTRALPQVQDVELFDWLKGLYPIWSELTADTIYWSTLLGGAELLLTGCTTTSDHHYVFPQGAHGDLLQAQFEAATKLGIRFHSTRGSMSRGESQGGLPPDRVVQDEETILADCARVIERYHDPAPFSRYRIALAPCSPFSVTEDLMRQTVQLARLHGVQCHTHLAETADENEYCLQQYGKRPLELMEEWEWLGSDIWFAHGIFFNDAEIQRLAQTQTGITHCPSSNMRLGSGIPSVRKLLDAGVRVGLGVDGSASNDSSNMLAEVRQALLLARVSDGAAAMTATDVLSMATRGSASLLGRDQEIGSIEIGKAADLALIRLDRLDFAGALTDPLAALIFCGIQHRVDMTIVGGDIVVREGRLTALIEEELTEQAHRQSFDLLRRAGVTLPFGEPAWIRKSGSLKNNSR